MNDRLRILMVSPSLPYPFSGFGTRVWQLSRYLAARHEVTMLCYARTDETGSIPLVAEACSDLHVVSRAPVGRIARRASQAMMAASPLPYGAVEQRSRAMQAALDRLVASRPFDVVQLESSRLCALDLPAGAVVIDEHNVEYELLARMHEGERSRGRRLFNAFEHAKFRRYEPRWWRRAAGVAVCSEREEPIVGGQAPATPVAVVPNGVDLDFYAPGGEDPEPDTIVFTGLLSYRPNLDAARHLVDAILPRVLARRPGALLMIVGHGHEADLEGLARPNVVVTGWVPDVRPLVQRAAVVATPLRMGGGTRLKIVEALGMGKAIVSTTLGSEGINVRSGEHLLLADDPDAFAAAVVRVLADPGLARSLGAAGRALAVREYSWTRSGAALEELYDRLARPAEPAPRLAAG
jgi:glycosyltransferase involved in cell wall biosynthesis